MNELRAVLIGVVVVAGIAAASEPWGRPGRGRSAIDAAPTECRDFTTDSQVALHDRGGEGEAARRFVDFTITVSVANPCPDPLAVRYGSFVTYRTSFAASGDGAPQPAACLGRQWSFSGTVPPRQKAPFTMRVERCFATSGSEPPTVVVEAGRVVTSRGEMAVPGLTRSLP